MSDRSAAAGWVGRSWLWWAGVGIWGAALFMLSANSHPPGGPEWPHQDKVLHALYFAGGSFCFSLALYGRSSRRAALRMVAAGMLFGAVTGALDEWHQTFTPGRSGNDPGDWLADVTGGLIGAWLAFQVLRWLSMPVLDQVPGAGR